MKASDIMVATRVSPELHAKILRRQRAAKKFTGIEPSVSAIVRAMIEEARDQPVRRRGRDASCDK